MKKLGGIAGIVVGGTLCALNLPSYLTTSGMLANHNRTAEYVLNHLTPPLSPYKPYSCSREKMVGDTRVYMHHLLGSPKNSLIEKAYLIAQYPGVEIAIAVHCK